MRSAKLVCLLAVTLVLLVAGRAPAASELDPWVKRLESLLPKQAAEYQPALIEQVFEAADAIDQWSAVVAAELSVPASAGSSVLTTTRELLSAKARVDRLLDEAFDQRIGLAAIEASRQRETARSYLRVTSELIELSGRLRYNLTDALSAAAARSTEPGAREQLLDLLIEFRSSVGAQALIGVLAEQPQPERRRRLFGGNQGRGDDLERTQEKVLHLTAISGQSALLPQVAAFLLAAQTPPELAIAAVDTIRAVGLPQDVRPGTDKELSAPAITARQVQARLASLDASRLSASLAARRNELLAWSQARAQQGITEESYRLETYDLKPGDWLLMRNPSPYNLFTDLSPGLFTHVGVVTLETGADGIRRMVLVDIQERGTRMSAVNIETFVQRSLHYVFLRHPDPAIAGQMAEAARSVIGNETEFDLNFRTARVMELRQTPLAGKKIRTYCAGLLLLCAMQTPLERTEFFPIPEAPAGGRTVENLATLGLTFGHDFISPSGALFSRKLKLVGRREPMYEPMREVEEAVFDHFALSLIDKQLSPAPELFDSLRYKLAESSRTNPVLAKALAKAAGVSEETDLVAAARAAAVVETLDEVAFAASAHFSEARDSIRTKQIQPLKKPGAGKTTVEQYRQRHADLTKNWDAGQLHPRDLRFLLVDYYIEQGMREIDRKFFGEKKAE